MDSSQSLEVKIVELTNEAGLDMQRESERLVRLSEALAARLCQINAAFEEMVEHRAELDRLQTLADRLSGEVKVANRLLETARHGRNAAEQNKELFRLEGVEDQLRQAEVELREVQTELDLFKRRIKERLVTPKSFLQNY
ncbi:unnamed protein product [Protopolystoma xenopodis]|uniref:Uncharacterized protein n=1 Tax=Protopolystoma xenopodis TaxID=117903 RepID=A0A3S5CKH5_9PLAT|nr:unnamed protein product [Protopolystoma xenopodis]